MLRGRGGLGKVRACAEAARRPPDLGKGIAAPVHPRETAVRQAALVTAVSSASNQGTMTARASVWPSSMKLR